MQTMFLNEVSLFQVGWMFTPAEHKLMTEWCDATTRAARTRTTRWLAWGWRGVRVLSCTGAAADSLGAACRVIHQGGQA